jgi:glycosyltransferase involved in cell wall biosynthesis
MSSRRRILFVDNLAVESSRRSLYRVLARREEFEVHLLIPKRWREQGEVIDCEEETDEFLKIHKSGLLFGFRAHRVIYTGLFRALRKIKPAFLLVDTEPENYAALEALIAVRLFSPETRLGLCSWRNIDYRQVGFPYKLAFTHTFCDSIVRSAKADLLLARVEDSSHLVSTYAKRTGFVPWPVDCSQFRKLPKEKATNGKGNFVIGYLGRIVESKGLRLVVESLPYLPDYVHLLMVGKGEFGRELHSSAVKLNVADRLKILPPIPYAHVPEILNRMDILVLPSLRTKYWMEQFGRVLIEAMACEVPVVASDSGGIPEVVIEGETGFLIRPGDSHGCAEKILRLLSDKRLRIRMRSEERL